MSLDEDTVDLIDSFKDESIEHLDRIDTGFLELDAKRDEQDYITFFKECFSCAHSIKGISGMLELSDLSDSLHKIETCIKKLENAEEEVQKKALAHLQICFGIIREMVPKGAAALFSEEKPNFEEDLKAFSEKFRDLDALLEMSVESELKSELSSEQSSLDHLVSDVEDALGDPLIEETSCKSGKDSSITSTDSKESPLPSSKSEPSASREERFIRVERDMVQQLLELASELVINQDRCLFLASKISQETSLSAEIKELVEFLQMKSSLPLQIQRMVTDLQLVPVKSIFGKIQRVAREVAVSTDKSIAIEFLGGEIKIDKLLLDGLSEPLIHLIRNAVDHGLETQNERITSNKDATGQLIIRADYQIGRFIFKVQDDGKGIDPQRIIQKAIEKEVITDPSEISEKEAPYLIFHPGFSTADKLTQVSGRGVGMDIVKRRLEDMGGQISIETEAGVGTTFTLTLPSNIGVQESLLIREQNFVYAVPVEQILETSRLTIEDVIKVGDVPGLRFRDEIVSLCTLDDIFYRNQNKTHYLKEDFQGNVLFFQGHGRKYGLVVQEILAKQKVVTKSLPEGTVKNSIIQAATHLWDGTAAVVLDPLNYFKSIEGAA